MNELETKIGHAFTNRALLERALTTPARRMSDPQAADNQRLEFLGDAVLGLLAAEAVYKAYPNEQEGTLTMRRSHSVSTTSLEAAAERLHLRDYLRLNAGAAPLAPHAKSLADAVEAIMGAVWLDGGFEAARIFFSRLALPLDEAPCAWALNPKGALQQRAQKQHPPAQPVYEVLSVSGPDHAPMVTVRVTAGAFGSAEATALSKTAAEVAAAAALMTRLENRRQPSRAHA